jgi:hypothetical protein
VGAHPDEEQVERDCVHRGPPAGPYLFFAPPAGDAFAAFFFAAAGAGGLSTPARRIFARTFSE